jgi:hypothetical protein
MNPFEEDYFQSIGITFSVESDKESVTQGGDNNQFPINLEIRKIDVFYNPELRNFKSLYSLPIFFKSLTHNSMS